jgi:hypothetical protein
MASAGWLVTVRLKHKFDWFLCLVKERIDAPDLLLVWEEGSPLGLDQSLVLDPIIAMLLFKVPAKQLWSEWETEELFVLSPLAIHAWAFARFTPNERAKLALDAVYLASDIATSNLHAVLVLVQTL